MRKKFNICTKRTKNGIFIGRTPFRATKTAAETKMLLSDVAPCGHLLTSIYTGGRKKKQPTSPANVRHIAICGNFVVILMRMVTPMRMPYFVASATRMHFKCLPDK